MRITDLRSARDECNGCSIASTDCPVGGAGPLNNMFGIGADWYG